MGCKRGRARGRDSPRGLVWPFVLVSGSLSRVCPGEKVRFTYTLCSDLACEPVFRAPCRQCLSERWNGVGCAGATGEATKADQVAAPGLMGLMGDYEDDDD